MSHLGKSHLVIMFTVGPDAVVEGDRIFASHGEWIKDHPARRCLALRDHSISKGRLNQLDPELGADGQDGLRPR